MTDLYLVDPESSPRWFPFGGTRPISELRAGAWLIRQRWETVAQGETRAIFADASLHAFAEEGVPTVTTNRAVTGPAVIGRSDFAPAGLPLSAGAHPARLVQGERLVGWWVPTGSRWESSASGKDWTTIEVDGVPLDGAADLVTALERLLPADTADFVAEGGDPLPGGSIVIGDPASVVVLGATVEPGVVFDTREGAVVLERGVYVKSGTRLEGPIYVGPGSDLFGGPFRACAIGPRCKLRGEISTTAFLGFANKAHEGFVGHSLVGRWVNLGAGTTTSNLKNTYGKVRLQVGAAPIPTERQYLGTLFGDHVKTAIGTMFGTGTVVGAGANVFGDVRPPKYVPPFAWGGASAERMDRKSFLAIAERVMARREVRATPEITRMLTALFDHAVSTR